MGSEKEMRIRGGSIRLQGSEEETLKEAMREKQRDNERGKEENTGKGRRE